MFGYLQAMDGEKDPRNLIIAFTCAQMVVQNFPLGVFVEDMFEVVSCYFPIDFSPVSTVQFSLNSAVVSKQGPLSNHGYLFD